MKPLIKEVDGIKYIRTDTAAIDSPTACATCDLPRCEGNCARGSNYKKLNVDNTPKPNIFSCGRTEKGLTEIRINDMRTTVDLYALDPKEQAMLIRLCSNLLGDLACVIAVQEKGKV